MIRAISWPAFLSILGLMSERRLFARGRREEVGLSMMVENTNTLTPIGVQSRRTRVIVIDDNRPAADTLEVLLRLHDFEVRVAYTGPDGLHLALEWLPDVVLCDIGLPGLDGYGVASALRQHALTARARLIAVTAHDSPQARERSLRAGFERHLVKPVDPAVLLELLAAA
jgi:CheY-like chemotaxis protein